MAKKIKTIEQIRADFHKSMQKSADKSGNGMSISIIVDGKEKKVAEYKPKKQ